MAYALKPGKPIRRELQRVVRKELGRSSKRLLHDRSDDAVHEGRKSIKKVKAVLGLLDLIGFVPPRKDRKRLRAAQRALSALRDADAMIETFDRARARFRARIPKRTWTKFRALLVRAKSRLAHQARLDDSLARAANALRKSRRSANQWPLPSIASSDLPAVFKRSFRRSRNAMTRAQTRQAPSDFHRWRKRVKTLWYQLRLTAAIMPGLGQEIRAFKKLETALGEDHNLVVLQSTLAGDERLRSVSSEIATLTAMLTALQGERRRGALVLGQRLHAASPTQYATRLRRRLQQQTSRRTKTASSRPKTKGRQRHRAHA